MTTNVHNYCPTCGQPIKQSTWRCPFCEDDIEWAMEERRLIKEYLRYAGAALVGSVLLSMAFLIPSGLMAMFPALIVPLEVALIALGAAVWLMAGSFHDTSTPVRGSHRTEEAQAINKRTWTPWSHT